MRFDTIVLHDAEDMIHPEALALIDRERADYAMVQVPVLPLPTKLNEVTHGVYCDEFAEFQTIDMHARQFSGSFVPSNGVGTGFAREILERLATERGDVFDADSLTEDYEIGVYIHAAGYPQLFAPLQRKGREFVATREYFPRTARSAIRQRTRWITGIALQCWERRGWRGNWRTRYWFWRDRKGLIANPINLLTNVLFLAGITSWCVSAVQHQPWPLAVQTPLLVVLCWFTLSLQWLRMGLRMLCVARVFGTTFALAVPLRSFHGNLINCSATLRALWRYAHARWQGNTLVWLKTEHAYPTHDALAQHRGELTDVLLSCGFVSQQKLVLALASLPPDANLAEHLRASGVVSDDDLCKALSLHTGVPSLKIDARQVKAFIARSSAGTPRKAPRCRTRPCARRQVAGSRTKRFISGCTRRVARLHFAADRVSTSHAAQLRRTAKATLKIWRAQGFCWGSNSSTGENSRIFHFPPFIANRTCTVEFRFRA